MRESKQIAYLEFFKVLSLGRLSHVVSELAADVGKKYLAETEGSLAFVVCLFFWGCHLEAY